MWDWTIELSTWESQPIRPSWDFSPQLVCYLESSSIPKTSLKSTPPNLLEVPQRVVLMYSDWNISTKKHASHNPHSSTNKWCSVVICKEFSKLAQFSELKIQIPTDTCVSSQVWILKWCSENTILKFLTYWLICSCISSKDLRKDLAKNSKLSETNITLSHSNARPQSWDWTSRMPWRCWMKQATLKNPSKTYQL